MSGTGFICGSRHNFGFKTKKAVCSVCGKEFMRGDQHGYHAGGKWQCSYKCFRIPEEEERRKFREELGRKLAVFEHSSSWKRQKQADAQNSDPEKILKHKLEVSYRREEYCKGMICMYTERVNRLPKGVKQRKQALGGAAYWREKLEEARETTARLEKELEANKNVQSTSEEKAIG